MQIWYILSVGQPFESHMVPQNSDTSYDVNVSECWRKDESGLSMNAMPIECDLVLQP